MSLEAVYELPASEIMYWHEFFDSNPMNSERLDWIMGQNATMIADFRNANRGKGKAASTPSEFMPQYLTKSTSKPKAKTREQKTQEALAWASA